MLRTDDQEVRHTNEGGKEQNVLNDEAHPASTGGHEEKAIGRSGHISSVMAAVEQGARLYRGLRALQQGETLNDCLSPR